MLKPFIEGCNDRINKGNCENLTGYTREKLLDLTGYKKYFSNSNNKGVKYLRKVSGTYPTIHLKIISETYSQEVILSIEQGTLKNRYLNISPTGKGYGLKVLFSQLKCALDAGLKQITLYASGDPRLKSSDNGYITWGKLGFTIAGRYVDQYRTFLEEKEIKPFKTLELLLLENYSLWEQNGHPWKGIFDLNPNSTNWEIFRRYVQRKLSDKNKLLERIEMNLEGYKRNLKSPNRSLRHRAKEKTESFQNKKVEIQEELNILTSMFNSIP